MVEVVFKRTRSEGITVNLWVYGPDNFKEKLRFTNDKAKPTLSRGVEYFLYWIIVGPEGGTLKIDRRILAVDADFVELLPEWSIPQDPDIPPGWPVAWSDKIAFTL